MPDGTLLHIGFEGGLSDLKEIMTALQVRLEDIGEVRLMSCDPDDNSIVVKIELDSNPRSAMMIARRTFGSPRLLLVGPGDFHHRSAGLTESLAILQASADIASSRLTNHCLLGFGEEDLNVKNFLKALPVFPALTQTELKRMLGGGESFCERHGLPPKSLGIATRGSRPVSFWRKGWGWR